MKIFDLFCELLILFIFQSSVGKPNTENPAEYCAVLIYSSMQSFIQVSFIEWNSQAFWNCFLFFVLLVYAFFLSPASMKLKRQGNRHTVGIGHEIVKYTNTFAYTWLPGILESISTNTFRKSHEDTKGTEQKLDELSLNHELFTVKDFISQSWTKLIKRLASVGGKNIYVWLYMD